MWHHPSMLFTPKKYGKEWTRVLGLSSCAAGIGFALSAVSSAIMADDWSEKTFGFLGFLTAAIVFWALGKDQLHTASKMRAEDGHKP